MLDNVSGDISVRLHHTLRGLRIGVYHNNRIIGMVQSFGIDVNRNYKVEANPHPCVLTDRTWFDVYVDVCPTCKRIKD